MAIILFIIILSILVLVHEFGHFIVAKKNGIRVEEFGLGLPPRVFGKKFGETLYSLNILPFGGFVKLTGEDEEGESAVDQSPDSASDSGSVLEEVEIVEKDTEITYEDGQGGSITVEEVEEVITETPVTQTDQNSSNPYHGVVDPKSFAAKRPWQRFSVLIAGVFMNAVLAVSLFYIFFFVTGFKTFQLPLFFNYHFKFGEVEELGTVVTGVQEGSGAEKAGVEFGEAVMEINGVAVKDVKDVKTQLLGKQDEEEVKLKLVDLRNQADPKTRELMVGVSSDSEGNPVLGVYLSKYASISYNKPIEKIFAGFLHSYNVMSYSFSSLAKIIGLSVETGDIAPVSQSVSGPVGIYNIIDAILKYGGGRVWLIILDYIALMSLSLATINILPFPALDGGRMFFVLWEAVTGRKVNPSWEANVHRIGMFFLLAFLIVITIKDLLM